MKNKGLSILLLLAAAVSTVYLLGLGYWNSFLTDDYNFIAIVRERGIWALVSEWYMCWQGRFGTFFLSGVMFKIFGFQHNLITITLVQLAMGYSSVYMLLRWLFPVARKGQMALISVLTLNLSLKSLVDFASFYWPCASLYVTLVFLTIVLVALIFNPKIKNLIAYVCIVPLAVLLGGGAETYTPMIIMCLGIVWLYFLIKKKIQTSCTTPFSFV